MRSSGSYTSNWQSYFKTRTREGDSKEIPSRRFENALIPLDASSFCLHFRWAPVCTDVAQQHSSFCTHTELRHFSASLQWFLSRKSEWVDFELVPNCSSKPKECGKRYYWLLQFWQPLDQVRSHSWISLFQLYLTISPHFQAPSMKRCWWTTFKS